MMAEPDQVGRRTGFAQVDRAFLGVVPAFVVAAGAGDDQAVSAGEKIDHLPAAIPELGVRLQAIQVDLGQASAHMGIGMAFDLAPSAQHDPAFPVRQATELGTKVQIFLLAGDFVQPEHGRFDAGNCHVEGDLAAAGNSVRLSRPPPKNIIGDFLGRFQRPLLLEKLVIRQQPINQIGHLMDIPEAPHAAFGLHDAQIAVRLLAGPGFREQMLFEF
jgi:hypothetical protein